MSLRVVGGSARGRPLQVPPAGTRPTSQRAREALFDRLATLLDLDGARVLDLYAGSGALGLEALSRGAGCAVLVDSDRRAVDVIRANARRVAASGAQVDVVHRDVAAFLAAPPGEPFAAVFADPPYEVSAQVVDALIDALADPTWTAPDAVLVIERASRAAPPAWPARIEALAAKRYGEATLWYGRVQ